MTPFGLSRQGSTPLLPSVAAKNRVPRAAANDDGEELALVLMSWTNPVPAAVPSLFHSSKP